MIHQNYASQILQNRSFKGLDLTGAEFSGSDLRGCDFTNAILVGTNFERVQTGQSDRQVKRLTIVAIVAPAVFVGLSLFIVQLPIRIFGDRIYQDLDGFLRVLPLLALGLEIFFRDRITLRFPKTTNLFGVLSVAILFQVMGLFTLSLAMLSLSSFGDGAGAQGLFLLVLAGFSAILTRRIFKWVTQAIHSSTGTSFRNADLTQANLSHAVVQNTDFSFATLTGACISQWMVQRHTPFTNVQCEYVYLEPAHQKRHPAEGTLRQGEAEQFLGKTNESF